MARGFNKAIIIGNLTRDPELKYTQGGTAVVKMTVAVNRTWVRDGEKQEEVDFLPVVVWGKMGENCGTYLRKGSSVLVEGRISVRSYEDKDGQKRYVTEIVAQTVQFLGGGAKNGESKAPGSSGSYEDQHGYESGGSFSGNGDEDIPF